jgi:superfamily II DNA or RNA helicase
MTVQFSPGSLVRARGREWVVLPGSDDTFLVLRPLGGGEDDTAGLIRSLESVEPASFPPPTVEDLGDAADARMLRTALRIGFRSSAGPFRSLANLAVEPRAYQFVPLLLALRQDPVRLLLSDDVGIGKTIESGLIAAELLAQGSIERMAVLCSPSLAEQWQAELRDKFAIDAELVLPSTVKRLTRNLMMSESLFDAHPFVVVSTDFIKAPHRRHELVNHCPELVIVDEAHSAVADGAGAVGARTQRYDLLQAVAKDPTRNLVLVTATPHSGKEEGFRNLIGLLDPDLATVDLDQVEGREQLARHFIQRRRADIRHYLDEDTAFPTDRLSREAPYDLKAPYAKVFDDVLDYAHDQIAATTGPGTTVLTRRVRWWSVLALLRALSSSPRAAAATLRTRAATVGAATVDEADQRGRSAVLDSDDDLLESLDVTPGADDTGIDSTDGDQAVTTHRERLLELAASVDKLAGTKADAKLALLIDQVRQLVADGYDPIVFCRFIDTADYLADHLTAALGNKANLTAVTGKLPPSERKARIDALAEIEGRHVLVATDCLSEGVNLQDTFDAVVHYDLAWNPTRHEQREGRVDRFGQKTTIVRTVTIYGTDNQIDGIVLAVLLRKHEAIRRRTGVSVPVPDESDTVVEALMEGLILRGRHERRQQQLDLDDQRVQHLDRAWESAAEREKQSQTKYVQGTIHPEEVAREVAAARDAIGTRHDIERFTRDALAALGASPTPTAEGFTAVTATTPIGLRDTLPVGHREPLPFHTDHPVPRGEALLARTDPHVEAVARFVLDTALDPTITASDRAAARCGVLRTRAVTTRTTLLVLRYRFHLDLPTPAGTRAMVSEQARFVAFTGTPPDIQWLDAERIDTLLETKPDANVAPDQAQALLERTLAHLDDLAVEIATEGDELGIELLEAHRRVRTGANIPRRGLRVSAQHPGDILGVYLYLPIPTGGPR